MNNLAKILEYAYANDYEKQKILKKDDFPEDLKELLLDSNTEESTLIRHEMHQALVDGADKRSLIRNVLPTLNVNTNKPTLTSTNASNSYIEPTAQGAAIPNMDGVLVSGQFDIKTYSTNIGITNELIEDQEWDIIATMVEKAGALLENSLNKIGIQELLDGHNGTTPSDVDPTGTNFALTDLINAKYALKKLYWGGGNISFIGHPLAIRYLTDSADIAPFVAPNFGGQLAGIGIYELATSGVSNWTETDAAGNYYGILLDSDNYAVIGIREDIHISSEMKDPIHDITNLTVSARFGVKVVNNQAAVRILSK